MILNSFKVIISTKRNLTDLALENLAEQLSELDIEQKVYGSIRELIRERISSDYDVDVEIK